MIDVQGYFYALKAAWVKRLSQAHVSESWFYIPCWYFNELQIIYEIWHTIYDINCKNITNTGIFKKLPGFFKEVVQSFAECNLGNTSSNGCIRDLCIWGNKSIVNSQKQSLYFSIWIESGIIRVGDIRFINKRMMKETFFPVYIRKLTT